MGLDFSKSSSMATPENTQQVQKKDEIEVVEQYDIVSDRQQMNTQLVGSQEVDDIVSTIEVNNLETIVSFGSEVAEEISKASDVVLNSMSMSQLDDTSEMLKSLAKIMDKFDIEEIKEKFPNKTIWIYSGYDWQDVKDLPCMKYVDVMVDGEFVEAEKDLTLVFRGSSNQRLLKLKDGIACGNWP